MELLDRYLQAVRFWLPKTSRQDDLLAELGEDLRSQVDDKETELGRPLDKTEVAEILRRCGSPMMVAARLGPQRHLIGPAVFPIYAFVLKMVLLWILVPVFLLIVGPVNLAQAGGNWGAAILNTFGDLWSGLFIAAGTITLVFAIVERTSAHVVAECKWDPLKLPPVRTARAREPKPSPLKAACEFGFAFFGLIWLLLVPSYPFLILGPAAAFLKAGPLLHRFYLPILLLGVVGLLRSAIRLARPQWGWFPSLSQLANTVLTLVVLSYMSNTVAAAAHTVNGSWYPFLIPAESVRDSAQYARIAAVVNASILIGMAGAWLGLCIAAVAQTWEVLRYLRQRNSGTQQPAQPRAA
jgi:hypothetical protein